MYVVYGVSALTLTIDVLATTLLLRNELFTPRQKVAQLFQARATA
jgi:hypothetical protein